MIAQTVAELLADPVRLTVEGIDRIYLNRSCMTVLTEVLPPPCKTSLGSRPSKREV